MEESEIEAFLSQEGKFLDKCNNAISAVIAENVKLKKALCELDTGGGDYLTSRRDIAKISGLSMMGSTGDEHLTEINKKINHALTHKNEETI